MSFFFKKKTTIFNLEKKLFCKKKKIKIKEIFFQIYLFAEKH